MVDSLKNTEISEQVQLYGQNLNECGHIYLLCS